MGTFSSDDWHDPFADKPYIGEIQKDYAFQFIQLVNDYINALISAKTSEAPYWGVDTTRAELAIARVHSRAYRV